MYFRLHPDAQKWFSNLKNAEGTFTIGFDFLYACFLVGIASGKIGDTPTSGDLIDYFPDKYKPSRSTIIGSLICAELSRLGVDVTEKEEVENQIEHLVKMDSPSKLSDRGVQQFNAYAAGGYEYLVQKAGNKPELPEEFLLDLLEFIDTEVSASDRWDEYEWPLKT